MGQAPTDTQNISIAAVIPTYNNAGTIAEIVTQVKARIPHVIVVDDGSTDGAGAILDGMEGIDLIHFPRNQGKGYALHAGFDRARERGFSHAITLDADGQHLAQDIPLFIAKVNESPSTLWIGNRIQPVGDVAQPGRSRFGARFSTFWYKFQTGIVLNDTQCGFRAYPLAAIKDLGCKQGRYEYEVEVLIRAAWDGVPVREIPVHRFYHPKETRVSHFRPMRDFLRVGLVNYKAAMIRMLLPWRFIDAPGKTSWQKVMFMIRREFPPHQPARRTAAALALGVCMGLSPFHGFQIIIAIGIAILFKMNKPLTLLGVTVSAPPFIPFWLALEYGVGVAILPGSVFVAFADTHLGEYVHAGIRWISHSPTAITAAIAFVQWLLGSIVVSVIGWAGTFALLWAVIWYFGERGVANEEHAKAQAASPKQPEE